MTGWGGVRKDHEERKFQKVLVVTRWAEAKRPRVLGGDNIIM